MSARRARRRLIRSPFWSGYGCFLGSQRFETPASAETHRASTYSPIVDAPCEHRLHVDYRRAVHRFEVAHPNFPAIDRHDLHPMQPNRIWPVGGAGVEHTLLRSRQVVAGVDLQHVAAGAIEPSEHDQLVTRLEAVE